MKAVWILVIVMLWSGAAFADAMSGQGTAVGNAVVWFSGTGIIATLEGTLALAGQFILEESPLSFSVSGWVRGAGSGDTSTPNLEAWVTFAASGSTESGDEIVVQGGLTLSGLSADAVSSSGSGAGAFFVTVFIDDQQYYAQGSADGSASGTFVVPEDPMSMELAGDALFNLFGEMTLVSSDPGASDPESQDSSSVVELLPWDLETWPEELLAQLLDILRGIVQSSSAIEEGS